MDHRTISQKPKPPNKVFHVKPLALAGLAAVAALSLAACQPPAEQADVAAPIGPIERIAMDIASMNLPISELEEMGTEETIPLPTPEEAEEETGITSADEGIEYAGGEVLITLKRNASIPDINRQLSLCDFIEETRIGNEMMVVGEIRDEKVQKGASGKAIVLVNTAEGVQVNQAIASLKGMGQLANASPNYLLTIQTEEAESTETADTDQEGSEVEQQ